MTSPNGLVLQTSDLNPFLFAGIGTEPNGSALTVLSLLARLGSDPWSEARRLANLPEKTAAEWLAGCIARTPLAPESPGDAHQVATTLVALLPPKAGLGRVAAVLPLGQRAASTGAPGVLLGETPAMRWRLIAVIWTVLAFGAASSAFYSNTSAQKASPAPTVQKSQ